MNILPCSRGKEGDVIIAVSTIGMDQMNLEKIYIWFAL